MNRIEEIQNKLKHELDDFRYRHTIGVMYTAASLAMCHGANLENAMLAGLLHDCAKCISLCEEYQIALTDTELKNHALIHPKLGAYIARENYGIQDMELLHAIAAHTTGHPDMTTLEKIIFIADYIEPGRDTAPHLTELRKLAFEDLNRAMYRILEDTLNYLHEKGGIIDSQTEATYQYYKDLTKKEDDEYGTGKTDGKACISSVGR